MFSIARIAEIIEDEDWGTLVRCHIEIAHTLKIVSTYMVQRRTRDIRGATIQETLNTCPDGFLVDHNGLIYRGGLFSSGSPVHPDEIKRVLE